MSQQPSDNSATTKTKSRPPENRVQVDPKPDPFDPVALRVTGETEFGVQKLLVDVAVEKPNRHVFVRCHPDPEFRLETGIFYDRVNQDEAYLVAPEIRPHLPGDVVTTRLLTTVTRHGDIFLWPIKIPDSTARKNTWNTTLTQAAEEALKSWIRVSSNTAARRYEVRRAVGPIPDPDWDELLQDKSLKDLLRMAFQGRYIESVGHPVLKALRGDV